MTGVTSNAGVHCGKFSKFLVAIHYPGHTMITMNTHRELFNKTGTTFNSTAVIHTECSLTFKSLAVTLHTTRFNIKKFYVVPTLRLCV
jgi:hypothetical protein